MVRATIPSFNPTRGLTLIEVMVTLTVFGLILSLTLWSYVQGVKANRRQNESSDIFRRANSLFGRIETRLENSRILHVQNDLVIFHPHSSELLTSGGSYNWNEKASTLLATSTGLELLEESDRQTIFGLKSWETLQFEAQSVGGDLPDQRPDYLTVKFTSTPDSVTRDDRTRSFERTLLLERF